MRAFQFEYELAKQEGILFHWMTQPVAIHGSARAETVECLRMEPGPPDATGRRSARPVGGSNFGIDCDMAIVSIGQSRLLRILEQCNGVQLDRGRVVVDAATGRTSNPKWYAGGDCVNGGREVVDAVAEGKRAALGIAQSWRRSMADLTTRLRRRIESPNPFWLASGPPANCGDQVMRAFDAGWGGAVWKTIGEPIVNVSSRYSSVDWNGQRMMGLNNIELITDRPIETNLREIAEVKKRYPNHAVIASLMVDSKREAWHDIVKRSEDAGADGLELNFGCPHGMSERGMGSAVGQVPEYTSMITEWVKEVARTPVLVKLTPNITRHSHGCAGRAQAAAPTGCRRSTRSTRSRASISTRFTPRPDVGGRSSHGGYCGPGGEADRAAHGPADRGRCRSGTSDLGHRRRIRVGATRRSFMLLGCGTVQVCTAAMHYGFRIVEDMIDGLSRLDGREGLPHASRIFADAALPRVTDWKHLDLNYKIVARINRETCIGCQLCYVACWDGAHQCIHLDGAQVPEQAVAAQSREHRDNAARKLDAQSTRRLRRRGAFLAWMKQECVGCNLCWLVCPVEGCITMEQIDTGQAPQTWEQRTQGGAR